MKIYGDHLTRAQTVTDITEIVKTCVEMEHPVAFSIEGEWGRGKTWIIDKVAEALQGIDISKANKKNEKSKKSGDYLVFKYNAWEKDYYEEPLLAILITLVNQLNDELFLENLLQSELKVLYEETKEVLEESLRFISKRVIGIDVVDVGKKGFQLFKKVKSNTKMELNAEYSENIEKDINKVVKALNRLSATVPVIFIVDELDRCVPLHAIRTLERLHHIFSKVHSSVTIISINEQQLKNTVVQMFGTNISFESYLRKFIDFRINLNAGYADVEELKIKLIDFFELFGEMGDSELQNEIVANVCGFMTAREFEKVCKNTILCHSLVKKDSRSFPKDCAAAELLLFACKVAIEKEDSRANILPIYGNTPKTNLGKYIKDFMKSMSRNACLDLSKSLDVILFICAEGLMLTEEMKITYSFPEGGSEEIADYYREYARYYKMIK